MDPGGGASSQGPHFKLALILFLILGTTGLGILIWLATVDGELSPQQDELSSAADWLLKGGFGALFGMLVDRRLKQLDGPEPTAHKAIS